MQLFARMRSRVADYRPEANVKLFAHHRPRTPPPQTKRKMSSDDVSTPSVFRLSSHRVANVRLTKVKPLTHSVSLYKADKLLPFFGLDPAPYR